LADDYCEVIFGRAKRDSPMIKASAIFSARGHAPAQTPAFFKDSNGVAHIRHRTRCDKSRKPCAYDGNSIFFLHV
jgi:hypothetical protein